VKAAEIPEPGPITLLPLDKHGRRIPWFVPEGEDGERDFRLASMDKMTEAVREHLCWICGHPRRHPDGDAYLVGPMCTVNRVSTEPASHRSCAIYAVQACPFMTHPHMRRRETGIVDKLTSKDGLTHNPGITAIWCTSFASFYTDPTGYPLFELGAPSRVWWWKQGRRATRAEALAGLEFSYPVMRERAQTEGDHAVAELDRRYAEALNFLPPQPA
jgi:hypothetical protein